MSTSTNTSKKTSQKTSAKPKILVWILLAAVVVAAVIAFFTTRGTSTAAAPEDAGQVVRENSRVLSKAPDEQAVLVEFLDYECESCRAAYPFIEPMYQRMYETQAEWGESGEDKSAVFRGFAVDLGLDMAAFDAAVADPATTERIKLDVADGEALGVGGTPTFYLDGEVLNPESLEQFRAEVETAATD